MQSEEMFLLLMLSVWVSRNILLLISLWKVTVKVDPVQ